MKLNKYVLLAAAGVLALQPAIAQKKNFTIAEATNGMTTTLAPKAIKQGSWQPGTNNFFQVANNAWVRTAYPSMKTDTVLSADFLKTDSMKAFPTMNWAGNNVYFQNGDHLFVGKMSDGKINWNKKALPENAENVFVDKTTGAVAFTKDNNLYLLSNDQPVQISHDADPAIVNGKSVHRDEFGIDHGIFFSPKGTLLAYYRMDQRNVKDYPVIDWSEVPAKNNNIKYPMAGGPSHEVTLNVFNPATNNTVTLKTGEPKDQYLTGVTWSPDEKYIFISVLNRDQNHLWLNQYDVATGEKVKTLFEETDSKYVHPEHGISFLPGSNDQFIFWSNKDGFKHLYLYNTDGKLVRQITKGSWEVNEIVGFNKDKSLVLITAAKESPLEKHSYAVNWKSGNMTRLDKEAGMHTVSASEDGKYIFDVFNGAGIPKKSMLRSVDGKKETVLIDAPNTLADFDRPEIKNITLKADDGTPLYGKLILPTHFDSTKKYPVIVYLYNGPNVQIVHNQFPESGNLWYEYMAQKGYVVFTMDGRGSSNRGMAFEQATFRKLGTVELNDQLKGVDYLKSLKYVDAARMGIHGWSFGGFMTTSMMLRNPDVFKCAVAGGPVIDWKMYEVMYTERYMDTPQDNAQGYEDANLLSKVKNLKGKLMLIHGTNDDVVVWQNSIKFLKKCVDENVQVDYFVYPGHPHNVRGKDRVHLMQKISDYFDLYLKP
ncbi:S9 family peptidase [Taibaiella soli]|uniref:S9 family peptidase n=1 Tax=Taibaiella soli TaxID=1649169 RepID=A0A2W2BT01_9BACT|nr:DPP IV N-terminal domain-containing protein [Taibaiella soli]PZF70883.1 S9 family peptidase [Taibaiella soli]